MWHLPLSRSRSHFKVCHLTWPPTLHRAWLIFSGTSDDLTQITSIISRKILQAGSSKPWPEVLQEAIGTNKLDANSLMKYFKPIIDWLKIQNVNETLGWPDINWVPPIPEGYPGDLGKELHSSEQHCTEWKSMKTENGMHYQRVNVAPNIFFSFF